MKKIITVCIIILVISSCSNAEKEAGMALYNQSDPYMRTFGEHIQEYSAGRFKLDVFYASNSQLVQNEYIAEMIDQRKDLLLINPVDRLGVYSIIKKLKSENIPVIFFNREPLLRDLNLYDNAFYVGAKAEQSGQLQAELIMDLFGGNPEALNEYDLNKDNIIQAVILKGEIGHQDAEIRTAEVVKSFHQKGFHLEILITEVANWNRAQAYEKMEQILIDYGNRIEVLISNNDAMALGAIDRMLDEGTYIARNGSRFPIIGIDGLEEAVEYIEKGYLYATVLNDSETQARAIVELADSLLTDKDLSKLKYPLVDGKYIWIDYKTFTDQ